MSYAAPIRAAEAKKASAPAVAPKSRRGSRGPPLAGTFQAKLALGGRSDHFEREADAAAAHVVGGRAGSPSISMLSVAGVTQRACAACSLRDDESLIQRKCSSCAAMGATCDCNQAAEEEHPELQVDRAAKDSPDHGTDALDSVADVIAKPGRPLPPPVRSHMEQGFGRDFGRVRIHDSPRAAASAERVGAHAYTVGNHIAFNRGQYRPDTESGRFLLAHELAHTIQQGAAPAARPARVSRPGDRSESEANRAARAAVSGAPVPNLTPSGPALSRYSLSEFGSDLYDLGGSAVDTVVDVGEGAVELAEDAYDAVAGLWDTAVSIANAIGGAVHRDGTTLVIDFRQVSPCPEVEFGFSLSDLGLDPTLYFPIVAGGLTIGVVSVFGALGVTANIDPGFTFRLEGCSFGPGQIRLRPLPPRLTVSGAASISTAAEFHAGADLGLRGDVAGLVTIPSTPPIVLVAPAIGLTAGGTMSLMLQHRGTLSHRFNVSMGLFDFSAAAAIAADVGFGLDFAYGLFGELDIAGLRMCRVGWPIDSIHKSFAAGLDVNAALAVGTSGFNFDFDASVRRIENPLDDLSFAFDESRLEDDCPLCDFFRDNGLMPGDNGYNWQNLEPQVPRLRGPLARVYARNPGFDSGALCRGTCGVDCPPEPTCDEPRDRIECREEGDRHYWYTYLNYATCGTHQGCRDHDACYDYAATMPIWGFGGVLIGPMYRACDLEAMCNYSFQQGVTWAMGGGPYDGRLNYADEVEKRPGCYGACPTNVAAEGEREKLETCIDDRELWAGLQLGDSWQETFGPWELYRGFLRVPFIGGIHYGLDGLAGVGADAGAELGPINLENACLTYDPATQTYSGSADLVAYLSGSASASITGALDAWGADVFCLARWLTLRGRLTGALSVDLPGEVRASVELSCYNGDLQVIPSVSLEVCPTILAELRAGVDFDVLGMNVWTQEWSLFERTLERCWAISFEFDPFFVGDEPVFDLLTDSLDIGQLLFDLFEPARLQNTNRRASRNPLPDRSVLLPCFDDDDDDDDHGDCPQRATGADGDRLTTAADREPRYGPVRSFTVAPGATENVGTWIEALYLTKEGHGEGQPKIPRNMQRGIFEEPGLPYAPRCVKKGYKQSHVYVRGHLLNAKVGGPAEERNLFPITGLANDHHKRRVEQGGLDVVHRVRGGNEVIYYKVEVQDIGPRREILDDAGGGTNLFEFDAKLHCQVANYQLCSNDTLRRNTLQTVDITSSFVRAGFEDVRRRCPR